MYSRVNTPATPCMAFLISPFPPNNKWEHKTAENSARPSIPQSLPGLATATIGSNAALNSCHRLNCGGDFKSGWI